MGGGRSDPVSRRDFALAAGIHLDVQDVPALRELATGDPDPSVRRAAVWSLGRFGHPAHFDLFMAALDDESSAVRSVAGWALFRIGPAVGPRLRASLRGSGSVRVREATAALLERMDREAVEGPGSSEVLRQLPRPSASLEPEGQWVERAIHDVMNLVQAVTGELEALSELPRLPRAATERVRFAEDAARFLLQVGHGLLDAGQLEAGGDHLLVSPVDVVEVAREAAIRGRPPAERDRVRVLAEVDRLEVQTDRTRLLRVLLNLVWNACKHSRSRDPVRLIVRARTSGVMFEVRDRGPGIPRLDRERILQAFRTGGRSVGESWGLGLSTAVRLLRQLRGQLTIEDRVRGGSVIRVELPREPTSGVTGDLPARSESSG